MKDDDGFDKSTSQETLHRLMQYAGKWLFGIMWMKMILSATENAKDHFEGAAPCKSRLASSLSFSESVSSEKQSNEVEMK